jgi:hypothetical protein
MPASSDGAAEGAPMSGSSSEKSGLFWGEVILFERQRRVVGEKK